MRKPFLIAAAVGVLVVLLAGLFHGDRRAFSLGVNSIQVAAELKDGDRVCQGPIIVPEGGAFRAVRVKLGTYGRPGPAIGAEVREDRRVIASGTLAAGARDNAREAIELDREIGEGTTFTVCLEAAGRAAFYGTGAVAHPSVAKLDGKDLPTDVEIVFLRDDDRSQLSLLPRIFDRVALFDAPGPWLPWVLLVGVLGLVPFAVHRALGAVEDEDHSEPG